MALVSPSIEFELKSEDVLGTITGRRQVKRFPEKGKTSGGNFVCLYELSRVGVMPIYYTYGEVKGQAYCTDPIDRPFPEKTLDEAIAEFNTFFDNPPTD